MPSILLRHEPRDLEIAEEQELFPDIWTYHNAQQWPLNYYAKIIYKKFTYGLKPPGKNASLYRVVQDMGPGNSCRK